MEASAPMNIDLLSLSSFSSLESASERLQCPKCASKRKYYCYSCCIPLTPDVPFLCLPVLIHILKCKKEPRSKSSAVPLKVLCPTSCELTDCLGSDGTIPEFSPGTYLIYPGEDAKELSDLTIDELVNIKTAVFIDSTWRQAYSMLQDENVMRLPMLKLSHHKTIFWRSQHETPESLATIEAIYYFLVDLHEEMYRRGAEEKAYAGKLDDILWYFVFTYRLVQDEYTKKRHKGKRFRRIPGYISYDKES